MAQESIYISDAQRETWEEIKKAASAEDRGIGYVLIEAWKKTQVDKK